MPRVGLLPVAFVKLLEAVLPAQGLSKSGLRDLHLAD